MAVDRAELHVIRAAEHDQKVRFVFDLPKGVNVTHEIDEVAEGLKVIIALRNEKAQTTAKEPEKREITSHAPQSNTEAQDNQLVILDKNYTGENVSIRLYKADLKDFFILISSVSGQQIEVSDKINKQITMKVADVPWDQAFDLVISFYGLKVEKKNNIVYVLPPPNEKISAP